ncbi:unnamed protein product [Paramecium pentaurelia]|uniref:TRAF3-interacting protein 1 n=1 Tax=Paramecium pentaurelia TaxID=43138 RepID=A0A8S1Y5U3_9CILI|nr:unnamed protein product [Paramecium pentaurelia]
MADFWKPTADMYSALFEKPKMSQKLLEKPPFKYIFDIIMETSKQTGYAKGLYTGDEFDSNYYHLKDRKIFFLQKIIQLTSIILDEELQAQPIKIVAGLEPEKTNVLLQAIYRAAVSGKNTNSQVEQILAAIGAGPILQEKEFDQVQQTPIIQQVNINSVYNNQTELIKMIDKQKLHIQGLEQELIQKNNIIVNQEQQIQALKNQLQQITNSDIFPLQFQQSIQND